MNEFSKVWKQIFFQKENCQISNVFGTKGRKSLRTEWTETNNTIFSGGIFSSQKVYENKMSQNGCWYYEVYSSDIHNANSIVIREIIYITLVVSFYIFTFSCLVSNSKDNLWLVCDW